MCSAIGAPWLVLLFVMAWPAVEAASAQPEQMHLSLSVKPSTMWATWVIPSVPAPLVTHGKAPAEEDQLCHLQPEGGQERIVRSVTSSTYRENRTGCRSESGYGEGCTPWSGRIYTAELAGLQSDTTYRYTCGGAETGFTPSRRFKSLNAANKSQQPASITFGVYGDQGSFSGHNPNGGIPAYNDTYPGAKLVRDSLLGPAGASVRFVSVIGDLAYANGNQPIWDAYGRDMEPLWSTVPALLSPGNHDGEFEFGNTYTSKNEGGGDSGIAYALRYPGPGPAVQFSSRHHSEGPISSTSMYWSRSEGSVHLVALAGVLGFERGSEQFRWLEADLKRAAQPAAREKQPWVVLTIHYPLYCTMRATYCDTPNNSTSPPLLGHPHLPQPSVLDITGERLRAALEPLMLKYGVDAVFTGHNHNYERTHAVRNLTVVSVGKVEEDAWGDNYTVYDNPGAPLHWVVGTGGADPDPVGSWRNASGTPPWMARRLYDDAKQEDNNWGWARVRATGKELTVCFIDAVRNRALDRVVIRKK